MAGPMELMKDFVVRGCVSGEDPSKQPDWRLKYTLSVWGSDSWAPGLGGRARQGWGKLGKRQRRRQHSSPRVGLRRQEELGAIGEPSIALRECAAGWGGARCVEELGELLGRGRSRQQPDGCQGGGGVGRESSGSGLVVRRDAAVHERNEPSAGGNGTGAHERVW